MKNLLAAECIKLEKSSVGKIWLGMIVWCVFGEIITWNTSGSDLTNGYQMGAVVYFSFGTLWFWLNSVVAVSLIAKEYETGTVRNMVSCGVDRGQIFWAKMIVFFSADLIFVGVISIVSSMILGVKDWSAFSKLLGGQYLGQMAAGAFFLLIVTAAEQLMASAFGILTENSVAVVAFTVVVTLAELLLRVVMRERAFTPAGALMAYFQIERGLMWKDFLIPLLFAAAGFLVCRRLFLGKEIR